MKVLFVFRGYGITKENSVVDFQRNTIINDTCSIDSFPIPNGGIWGYLQSFFKLRSHTRKNSYDIIHAHYSFSGYISVLATNRPVICSLMGSDVLRLGTLGKIIVRFFSMYIWHTTIVKSKEMLKLVNNAFYLPNGVEINNFRELDRNTCIERVGFSSSNVNIIFVAQNPQSYIKNHTLAEKSVKCLNDSRVVLHTISNISFDTLPYYYNAADLLLLTSISEGSPNVIKEAMACNCPIVSTDVGDVRFIVGDTEGCFISHSNEYNLAEGIKEVLSKGKRTKGRDRIIQLRLDADGIASKLRDLYQAVISKAS